MKHIGRRNLKKQTEIIVVKLRSILQKMCNSFVIPLWKNNLEIYVFSSPVSNCGRILKFVSVANMPRSLFSEIPLGFVFVFILIIHICKAVYLYILFFKVIAFLPLKWSIFKIFKFKYEAVAHFRSLFNVSFCKLSFQLYFNPCCSLAVIPLHKWNKIIKIFPCIIFYNSESCRHGWSDSSNKSAK